MQINWSERNIQEIELFFSTDIRKGLDKENYENAKKQYGANIIKSKVLERQNFYGLEKKKSNLKFIFSRAVSIFGIIYIALLVILQFMDADVNIYVIAPFLAFSIISAVILGSRSEKKHAYLHKLCRPRALVMRNGRRKRVFIESIVPGDLIILSTGDIVPADARLISANSLSCIEITTENRTAHIKKTDGVLNIPKISLSDDIIVNSNIVFATDIIASGSGLAVVIATGKNTRIIRTFAHLEQDRETSDMTESDADETSELSQLQKDTAVITQKFSLISVLFAMILLILGILMQRDFESVLLVSFTLVASMFTDKLPVIIDFAVMQGLINLSQKGMLIKKSSTVDKLNRIDTLIAKKNETYIKNELKFQKIYYDHWDYDVIPKNTIKIGKILSYMALCSNVDEVRTKKNKIQYTGLPIDIATVKAFKGCGLNFTGLYEVYERYGKTAYNPQSGYKSVFVYDRYQNKFILVCLGEAENILKRCARRESGVNYINFDRRSFNIYKRKIDDLYKSYDWVMAVAIKEYEKNNISFAMDENNLDFLGIISLSEANIFGVYENIDYLKKSGVSPVMIVDANNHATQRAAKRLGVLNDKRGSSQPGQINNQSDFGKILDDDKIAWMGDGVFYSNAHKYRLFMPISIQNRVKFLKALKFRKKTSAVTVSDLSELPVLTESDISFTQTAVETGVLTNKASVILKNLSISSILNVVKGAAVIYKNVYNIISFAVSFFTAQYLLVFFALIFDGMYMLNVSQMIWGGIIVGYMCALAMCFGEDTNKWYIFRSKLKNYKKYSKEMIKHGISTGILIFFTVVISFALCLILENDEMNITDTLMQYIGSDKSGGIETAANILSAQTGGFIALIFVCLTITLINIKSKHLSDLKIFKNTVFMATIAGNIILLAAVMAIPFLNDTLGFALLSAKSIVSVILIGIIIPSVFMFFKIKKTV